MRAKMDSQARLAMLYREQKMIEREVARNVERVKRWIDDGHNVSPMLRNAIRLPIGVLSLPDTRKRFDALYCDAFAQFESLNDN